MEVIISNCTHAVFARAWAALSVPPRRRKKLTSSSAMNKIRPPNAAISSRWEVDPGPEFQPAQDGGPADHLAVDVADGLPHAFVGLADGGPVLAPGVVPERFGVEDDRFAGAAQVRPGGGTSRGTSSRSRSSRRPCRRRRPCWCWSGGRVPSRSGRRGSSPRAGPGGGRRTGHRLARRRRARASRGAPHGGGGPRGGGRRG